MRPSDITDGNRPCRTAMAPRRACRRFNEAVGYYRRKLAIGTDSDMLKEGASMRPSDITDGNDWRRRLPCSTNRRFNEAVGYYRRKHPRAKSDTCFNDLFGYSFNEAVGYYRRKHRPLGVDRARAATASMRPSDITDGNQCRACPHRPCPMRFNEAVGYYRRKRV